MKKMIVSSTLILSMTAFIINFCACGSKAEEVAPQPEVAVAQEMMPEQRSEETAVPEAQETQEPVAQEQERAMGTGEVVELSSEADFNGLIARGNVVVDFYAVWCGPCKALAPVVHSLAQKNKDVTFVKVNTDTFSSLSGRYGVKSLPTLVFFKNGQKVETLKGSMSESKFSSELRRVFGR
jgi:thioredoxin 1